MHLTDHTPCSSRKSSSSSYLVDLALSFKSIEASLILFFLLALFYALAPIPVVSFVYRTVAGRRGNGTNRIPKD